VGWRVSFRRRIEAQAFLVPSYLFFGEQTEEKVMRHAVSEFQGQQRRHVRGLCHLSGQEQDIGMLLRVF
jgi:hypothetical protein